MKTDNIYITTLNLIENSALVDKIYKEKESGLTSENKQRLSEWLSFFIEHKDILNNLYAGTVLSIFKAIGEKELLLKQRDISFTNSRNFYLEIIKHINIKQKLNEEKAYYLLNLALIYGVYCETKIKTIEESVTAIEKEITEDTVFKFFLNLFTKEFYHSVLPKTAINGNTNELYRLIGQDICWANGRTPIEKNTRVNSQFLSMLHYTNEMDIDMINEILPDTITYNDMQKKDFIKSLDILFDEFKSYGDTHLIHFRGSCNACYKGKAGFSFIGNHSKNYINIIISLNKTTDDIEIKDIYDCSSLTHEIGVLKLNKQLKINSDLFGGILDVFDS